MLRFTPEQAQAITLHDRNLIVTAGAGSGKTRVLVERFIALLKANPHWPLPSIVAITFTDKAAREMRDRIRAALDEQIRTAAATGDGDALAGWMQRQAELNAARIGTIHSLCAQILRANAAECNVDPAFEVLDENEAAILRDDAVDLALVRLAEDEYAAALVAEYGLRVVRNVLGTYIGRSQAQTIVDALAGDKAKLQATWRAAWRQLYDEGAAELRADAQLLADLAWVGPGELPDDLLSVSWRLVHAHARGLLDGDAEAVAAAIEALTTGIVLRGGKAAAWGGDDGLVECKAVLGRIRDRLKAAQAALPPPLGERDELTAEWLGRWGHAIKLAASLYAALKDVRRALDFDDLECLARDLLVNDKAVAARACAELNQVLVDEFQDTNPAQRDIVYTLARFNDPDGAGRLFVVGDPKQSIYGFRGADVTVFGAVRDDICLNEGQEVPLATSFRTHDGLVQAFNALFARILGDGAAGAARYEVPLGRPMTAHRPCERGALPLHATPLHVIAVPKLDDPAWQKIDDLRRWEAWELTRHIHEQVSAGTLVWDRDLAHDCLPADAYVPPFARDAGRGAYRPMDYGDVAVLFQAMTRVPQYEDVFKAAGLPYVTLAGKGYFNRPEVWDLLHLLRALHNPADDLALAVALRSPLFGLSDDALLALRLSPDGAAPPLWDVVQGPDLAPLFPEDERNALTFAAGVLRELHDMAGCVSIAELLVRTLNMTHYLAALTGLADGARRRGNVEKLLALARASGRISLGAFNAYARDLTAREVREGEAVVEVEGAVRIMSVHASKGLEFPVVALADATWTSGGRGGSVFQFCPEAGAACQLPTVAGEKAPPPFAWHWAERVTGRRERAERRRLLYVGATRAQDALIVSGTLHKWIDDAWLMQWLDALGLSLDTLSPAPEPQIYNYEWGSCAIHVPAVPPGPDDLAPRAAAGPSPWAAAEVRAGRPFDGIEPARPPLLAPAPVDVAAPGRVLTATQIAALGRAPFYAPPEKGRAAFRHAVLHDAPEPVRPLPQERRSRAAHQIVGDVVHRALRQWLLPSQMDAATLLERLRGYAWERQLASAADAEAVAEAALALLRQFEAGEVMRRLDGADQVYRELPFAYQRGDRAIHGVIDLLYHTSGGRKGGQWHVLDYKTALVSERGAYGNAQRYTLQVGVYAEAVAAKTGQIPETYLYYIHPNKLVYIRTEAWQAALAGLDDAVAAALE